MMDWHDGWGPGAWIAMGLMMLLFWTLVVAAIFALLRPRSAAGPPTEHRSPGDGARRILDERFARGEIDAEEYRHRRELLGSS